MLDKLNAQELNENVSEYFPDYGAVKNAKPKFEKESKALIAKSLAAAAAAGVVALALVPYIICNPLSISKTNASISAKVMNLEEGKSVSYFLDSYPGRSDESLLKAIAENPQMGKPFPEDHHLTLQGLEAQTPYRLVFFTQEQTETGSKPQLVGEYAFKTGEFPVPAPLKWLQDLFGKEQENPELPEIPLQTETKVPETTEATEVTTEVTTETATEAMSEVPTEAATEPSETVKPTNPSKPTNPPKPTDPPATDPPATDPPTTDPPATDPPATDPPATDPPATDPPATDPPATDPPATDPPPTDPPAPVVSEGQSTAVFTERTDGKAAFGVKFPFTLQNGTATRAEFKTTHTRADGSIEQAPVAAAQFTQTGDNVLVELQNAEVILGEGISIQPVLYYEDGAGVETSLSGTAYEVMPAGFTKESAAVLEYDNSGESLSYQINASGIINSSQKQPADSSLTVEAIEFTFLDPAGNSLGQSHIEPVSDPVNGNTYTKSGTITRLPEYAYGADSVSIRLKAAWKVGGQNALLSSTLETAGQLMTRVEARAPQITEAAALAEVNGTRLTVAFPFKVQGAQAENLRIEATGGAFTPNIAEGVPTVNSAGEYVNSLAYEIYPDETVQFNSVLSYLEKGQPKTLSGQQLTLSPASLAKAGGTLGCTYNGNNTLDYQLDLSGIYNIQSPSSGFKIADVQFRFDSGTGNPLWISAAGSSAVLPGGVTTWSLPGSLDLRNIPTGTYTVSAVVSGKWTLNGLEVQAQSSTVTVTCDTPIEVINNMYTVSLPSGFQQGGFTVTATALGVEDSSGTVTYESAPVKAREGEKVYIKLLLTGRPTRPCDVDEMLMESAFTGALTRVAPATLPFTATGMQDESVEYIYQFTMPAQDVSDIVIQGISVTDYISVEIYPFVLERQTLNHSASAIFKDAPSFTSGAVQGPDGWYAKDGSTVTISADIGIRMTNPDGMTQMVIELLDQADINSYLGSHQVVNFGKNETSQQPDLNPSGTLVEGLEHVTFQVIARMPPDNIGITWEFAEKISFLN